MKYNPECDSTGWFLLSSSPHPPQSRDATVAEATARQAACDEAIADAEREVDGWRLAATQAEARVRELEGHMQDRCLQTDNLATQLQSYMQAESTLFQQREARDEEIRGLRVRIAVLEKEADRMQQHLEAEVEAKFKLAQSKNHLQRIHLLESTKAKLDATMKDLTTERSKVSQLSARFKKIATATSAGSVVEKDKGGGGEALNVSMDFDMQTLVEQSEAENMAKQKLERYTANFVRVLHNRPSLAESDELSLDELDETLLANSVTRLHALVQQTRQLQREVEDRERQLRHLQSSQLVTAQTAAVADLKATLQLDASKSMLEMMGGQGEGTMR
jgi:hypothetical protein